VIIGDARFEGQYRNPASPNVLFEPTPWDEKRSEQATPRPDYQKLQVGLSSINVVPNTPTASSGVGGKENFPRSSHALENANSLSREVSAQSSGSVALSQPSSIDVSSIPAISDIVSPSQPFDTPNLSALFRHIHLM
jgi:hypothetical protein